MPSFRNPRDEKESKKTEDDQEGSVGFWEPSDQAFLASDMTVKKDEDWMILLTFACQLFISFRFQKFSGYFITVSVPQQVMPDSEEGI